MRSEAPGGTSPTYLAWDGAQRFLYAGNGGQGRVASYTIGAAGALARLGDVSTAGMGYMASVTHLSVHPTGNWVLTAHFDSGHVAVLPVATNGLAGAPVDIEHPATEAHQIVSDAGGGHVFVPCRSGNVIAQYAFDSATGQLTAANPALVQADAGAGPRHIAFHPNQQSAYVINELNGTITSTATTPPRLLSMPQTISAAPAGMTETVVRARGRPPVGKFVYASNRTTNTIGMFSVDATSGRLTTIGHETGGGMVAHATRLRHGAGRPLPDRRQPGDQQRHRVPHRRDRRHAHPRGRPAHGSVEPTVRRRSSGAVTRKINREVGRHRVPPVDHPNQGSGLARHVSQKS